MSTRYPFLYGKASRLVKRIASLPETVKQSIEDSKYQTLPAPTPYTLMRPTTFVSPTAAKIIGLSEPLANDDNTGEVSAASKRASTMAMHTTSPNSSPFEYDEDLANSSLSGQDFSESTNTSPTLTPPGTTEHESVGESIDDDGLDTPTATGDRRASTMAMFTFSPTPAHLGSDDFEYDLQSPRPVTIQGRANRLSPAASSQITARVLLFDSLAASATQSTNDIVDVFSDSRSQSIAPPPTSKVDDSDTENNESDGEDVFYTPSTGSVLNVSPPIIDKDVFSVSPALPELMDIEFRTPTSTKRKRNGFAGPSKPAPSNADNDVAPASKRQKRQPKRQLKRKAADSDQDNEPVNKQAKVSTHRNLTMRFATLEGRTRMR